MGIRITAVAASGVALVLAIAGGCGNKAVGVDACRQVEQARCEAVVGCPGSPVEDDEDVNACKLFYRDQCLFGLAGDTAPEPAAVEACTDAIAQAGACKTTPFSSCVGAPALVAGLSGATTGCGAISVPESLAACAFLGPVELPDGGTGGSAGAGGAGGSGGGGGTGGGTAATGGAGGAVGGGGSGG